MIDADQINILDTYLDSKINAGQGYRKGTFRWEDGDVRGLLHTYVIDESPVIEFARYTKGIKKVTEVIVGEKVGIDLNRAGVIFDSEAEVAQVLSRVRSVTNPGDQL